MTDITAHDLRVAASRGDTLRLAQIVEFADAAYCLLFGSEEPEGRFHFVQRLLNDKDRHGCTALHFACNLPNAVTAFFLIRRGADPNSKDNSGATPLFYACSRNGSLSLVRLLVSNGAKIHIKDRLFEKTPLHQACGFMGFDTIKYLALLGANTSAKDNSGMTPLHYFAKFKCCHHEDSSVTAHFLMQHNPLSLIAFDENGNTPVDLCFCESTAKFLLESGSGTMYSWIAPWILSVRNKSNAEFQPSRYLDSFIQEPLTVLGVPKNMQVRLSMNPALNEFQSTFALTTFTFLSKNMENLLSCTAVDEIVNEIMSFLSALDVMQHTPFSI